MHLDFAELVDGDLLVHLQHGICWFLSLGKIEQEQKIRRINNRGICGWYSPACAFTRVSPTLPLCWAKKGKTKTGKTGRQELGQNKKKLLS